MKNKQKAALRLLAALLALTLLAPLGLTASAADGPDTIYIDSASDFVSFAKSCALDTWSAGKTVILRADISLAGMDYTPVAAFGGTFDGGGHTISDLNLTGSYSPAGLFAVILSGGSVEDLNVAGSVAAAGDKIVAGGIAGENYGRIVCCSFTGMVQGSAQIGGIAGVNRVSGQIISSTFDGKVQATNATGGIAGLNEGIIRHCTNTGSINTNNVDASLSLSDIQIDTTLDLANLTTSQTFLTTTETGGIAGTNTGLIAGCKNTGTVGYEHVGYNIGGIAGSTSGYLRSNTNEGTILGRKDVGGIAGQVEPYVAVTVSESTKDQLQTQLQDLRTLTDRATADAGGAASTLGSQLAGMGTYLDGAANAANNLRATATIDAGALADGSVTGGADLTVGDASAGIGAAIGAGKDADLTIDTHPLEIGSSTSAGIGAGVGGFVDPSDLSLSGGTDGSGALSASLQMNADASMPELASALSGMGAQMRAIGSQAANLSTTLQNDVQAISDKLEEINDTVFAAMDELENRDLVTDGSQTDPDSITLGAVRACENTGTVQADRNVGGIAGAMGLEYSADPESKFRYCRVDAELDSLTSTEDAPTLDSEKLTELMREASGNKDLTVEVKPLVNDSVPVMLVEDEQTRRFNDMGRIYGHSEFTMPAKYSVVLNSRSRTIEKLAAREKDERSVLLARQLYDLAELFKVFGDSTRIKILYALMNGDLYVNDIAEIVGVSQSAVSHQLRVLKQARLVKFTRDGKNVTYSLADDHVYAMLSQGLTHICE